MQSLKIACPKKTNKALRQVKNVWNYPKCRKVWLLTLPLRVLQIVLDTWTHLPDLQEPKITNQFQFDQITVKCNSDMFKICMLNY